MYDEADGLARSLYRNTFVWVAPTVSSSNVLPMLRSCFRVRRRLLSGQLIHVVRSTLGMVVEGVVDPIPGWLGPANERYT